MLAQRLAAHGLRIADGEAHMSKAIREILVPVDGSEGALRAAAFAASLARATGAKITLLHAYDANAIAFLGLTTIDGRAVDDAVENQSARYLALARSQIGDSKLIAKEVATVGSAVSEIVGYAERNACDLIVMGSRHLSATGRALEGSVSTTVAHRASCPVTIVP